MSERCWNCLCLRHSPKYLMDRLGLPRPLGSNRFENLRTEETMSNKLELLSRLAHPHRFFPEANDASSRATTDGLTVGDEKLPTSYSEALNLVQRVFLA